MILFFTALNLLLLLACPIAFAIKTGERRVSLSLIQALIGLPLLAGQYVYFAYHMDTRSSVQLLLFSESIFALLWLSMAYRMARGAALTDLEPRQVPIIQLLIGVALAALAFYCRIYLPAVPVYDEIFATVRYGPIYFYALILLAAMLAAAWRLEVFWRALAPARRWEYKFLVVGGYIVCGGLVWAASYRLTYRHLVANHFFLLATVLFFAWLFMCYAVAHHRLLNRKIFISRKIIYSFVAPTAFAVYMFVLGLISLVMKTYGLTLPYVLRWLAISFGLIALALFTCSSTLRRRVKFFISTHFYVNKYEYRDEWLALSARLQGALTEADVVYALHQVLTESLYTTHMMIWIGDTDRGYKSVSLSPLPEKKARTHTLASDDPLVRFFMTHTYFYVKDKKAGWEHRTVAAKKSNFLARLNLVLMVPLFIGNQLVGIIGLGPEFTGGRYGHDDFDLLIALGTQTAAALVAVRMAEQVAHARERQAWNRLSAFVLHDIKNAASMLSLVRENAPDHIHNPEFQQDMLETIDDVLARMNKVQQRLDMLKEEISPVRTDLELQRFLKDFCRKMGKKLVGMAIDLSCTPAIRINTDTELLSRILENLLLNAFEADGEPPAVWIDVASDTDKGQITIRVTDNGSGIVEDLLPDALFEPFKTTKAKGSGIGLWQTKQLVTHLKGTIRAQNAAKGGARFVIRLPI